MRSGFVALLGRPNAGKSTLLNELIGTKVSIVSNRPQTTRHKVLGAAHRPGCQIVFVDTPGLHKPVNALGRRLNAAALSAARELEAVDVACLVVDAAAPLGTGDQFVWDQLPERSVFVLTQCDRVDAATIARQLDAAAGLGADAYFVVSGRTGDGTDKLLSYLDSRMGEGPPYFPADQVSNLTEPQRVAEVVREELINRLHEELPYSVATVVTRCDEARIVCEIIVERSSQRGIVIGRKGSMLAAVGTAARAQLGLTETFLELKVRVEPNWQHDVQALSRLIEPGP